MVTMHMKLAPMPLTHTVDGTQYLVLVMYFSSFCLLEFIEHTKHVSRSVLGTHLRGSPSVSAMMVWSEVDAIQ